MATVQALPSVRHDGLSAAHLPPVHVPLQQLASLVQAALSDTHAGMSQTPPVQVPEQHSDPTVQTLPIEWHPGTELSATASPPLPSMPVPSLEPSLAPSA